jgi:hypothetical protein
MGLKWRFLVVAAFFGFSWPYKRMIKYIVYVVRYEEKLKNTTDLNQFFCILYRDLVTGPVTLYRWLFKGRLWWIGKRVTENLVKRLLEENYLLEFEKFTNSGTDAHELQCERILGAETMEERKRLLEEVDVYKKTDKLIYYQEL